MADALPEVKGRASNTGPSMYESNDWSLVRAGLDGITAFANVPVPGSVLRDLSRLRLSEWDTSRSEGRKAGPVVTRWCAGPLATEPLLLSPLQWSGVSYILENDYVQVKVFNPDAGLSATTGVSVQVKARALWCAESDTEQLVGGLLMLFQALWDGELVEPELSSFDYAADVATAGGLTREQAVAFGDRLVGRIGGRSWQDVGKGSRAETMIVGRRGGAFFLRVYEKSREIRKSGKLYMRDLWDRNGWDRETCPNVYRFEAAIGREGCKRYGTTKLLDLPENMPGMIAVALSEQVRHVVPTGEDSNMRRWNMSPFWLWLRGAIASALDVQTLRPGEALTQVRQVKLDKIAGQAIGTVLSWMALMSAHADYRTVSASVYAMFRWVKHWERRKHTIWRDALECRRLELLVA